MPGIAQVGQEGFYTHVNVAHGQTGLRVPVPCFLPCLLSSEHTPRHSHAAFSEKGEGRR